MIGKILKGIWLLSLMVTVLTLLYSYASFPENIQLQEEGSLQSISRNGLFYSALALLGLSNALVFVVDRLIKFRDPFFRSWFFGLVIFFNLFMLVSLQFFSLYNSQEKFDYSSIGFVIYGSVSLLVIWASLWPLNMIIQQVRPKRVIGDEVGD